MLDIIRIVAILFISVYPKGYAQDFSFKADSSSNLIVANKDILFNMVKVLDKNGNIDHGFLIGIKSDTLVINRNRTNIDLPIKDLLNITIKKERNTHKGIVIGSLFGLYAGNLAIFTAKHEPTAYWDDEDAGIKVLLSSLFIFAGGGIGYLVDLVDQKQDVIFEFRGDKEAQAKEIERLTRFLNDEKLNKLFHLNFYLSHVYSRFAEVDEKHYYYRGVSSFNLLRRMQMTYSWADNVEFGVAICWFGEPSIRYSNYNEPYHSGEQSYRGVGFYAITNYHPLKSKIENKFSWTIGAGLGIGNVDYSLNRAQGTSYPLNSSEVFQKITIDKSYLSAIVNTQFELQLIEQFSLGLFADYIYLPDKMPALPEVDVGSRTLGNFSLGLTMGLHF